MLRGVPWADNDRLERVREQLESFEEFEATRAVSERAADMYRLDREEHRSDKSYNVEKRRFDVFHVASAGVHGLEMVSADSGVGRLLEVHERLVMRRRESSVDEGVK